MEKQKKWRFNVIDVLFALVVLAAVGLLAFRLFGPDLSESAGGDPEDYYVITFYSDAVPNYVLDHVRVNASVTDDSLTRDFGTVLDVQTAPSVYYGVDSLGNTVPTTRDDTSSLRLILCAKASGSGTRVSMDGFSLDIGSATVVRAEEAKMYLTVYDYQKLTDTSYELPAAETP